MRYCPDELGERGLRSPAIRGGSIDREAPLDGIAVPGLKASTKGIRGPAERLVQGVAGDRLAIVPQKVPTTYPQIAPPTDMRKAHDICSAVLYGVAAISP